MKTYQFILTFFFTFILLVLIYAGILIFIDPKQTIGLFSDGPFSKYHDNFVLKKIEHIKFSEGNFDTLIVGSSTSGAFEPADVDEMLGAKSYLASLGGGVSVARYAVITQSLESFADLKKIIYVVDFFEFNKNNPSGEFRYNSVCYDLSSDINIYRSFVDYMRYHFSNRMIGSAYTVYKKFIRNSPTYFNENGTTSRSMVLSKFPGDLELTKQLTDSQHRELMRHVEENVYTYSSQVLANFNALNPDIVKAFKLINDKSLASNIEIIYLLSPYQFDFRESLMKNESLRQRYTEWRELFSTFSLQKNITVVDPIDWPIFIEPRSSVWRDGIHFNRQSALNILRSALDEE